MAAENLVELPYEPPFSLSDTLKSGQVFHWEALNYRGVAGFVGCIGSGPPAFLAQGEDGRVLALLRDSERLVRYFGLDQSPAAIRATFPAEDHVLREAIAFCPGIRVVRQPLWECLATFITSSLKQVAHIRAISLTLRRRFGVRHEFAESECFAYPEPDTLACVSEEVLRQCALGYRAKSLLLAARAVSEGTIDPAAVESQPDLVRAREMLTELHGVGDKIANCALLFGAGRWDAFPIDVWIERILREHYRKRVKGAKLAAWATKHFGPNAGYAQQYLFHFARKTL